MTSLIEVLNNLEAYDSEHTIYASEPWTQASIAIVSEEPDSGRLPTEASDLGLEYFLEVFIASDFLEDWMADRHADPSAEQKCERLIAYAVNDA